MTADTNLGHSVERCGALSDAASEAMRWIPTSERLPEVHVEVLMYRAEARIPVCGWSNGFAWFSHGGFIHDVSHWMPLPPPPASRAAARTQAAETVSSHNAQAEWTKPALVHQDSASGPAPDAPVIGLETGGSR